MHANRKDRITAVTHPVEHSPDTRQEVQIAHAGGWSWLWRTAMSASLLVFIWLLLVRAWGWEVSNGTWTSSAWWATVGVAGAVWAGWIVLWFVAWIWSWLAAVWFWALGQRAAGSAHWSGTGPAWLQRVALAWQRSAFPRRAVNLTR